jgi:hypothetical protein
MYYVRERDQRLSLPPVLSINTCSSQKAVVTTTEVLILGSFVKPLDA